MSWSSLLGGVGIGNPAPKFPDELFDTVDKLLASHPAAQTNAQLAMAAQAQANAQNQNWAGTPPPPPPPPTPTIHQRARSLFFQRMSGVRGDFKIGANDFLMCHVHRDEVFVFYLLDGKEGIVRENVEGFPSDQLITQFRLVLA